jgi:hypothetical protein
VSAATTAWPARTGRFLWRELKLVLPSTIYFFCAFNMIALSSSMLIRHYWFSLSNFLVASGLALVVGKVILVTAEMSFLDRYRNAPMIWPILFKTTFYAVVVGLVRLLEQTIDVARDERGFRVAFNATLDAFTWQHFTLVQAWLFVTFLLYATVTELAARLDQGGLLAILFRRGARGRPS